MLGTGETTGWSPTGDTLTHVQVRWGSLNEAPCLHEERAPQWLPSTLSTHSEASDSKQLETLYPELLNKKTDQNMVVSAKRVLNKLHSISLKQLPELQPRIT